MTIDGVAMWPEVGRGKTEAELSRIVERFFLRILISHSVKKGESHTWDEGMTYLKLIDRE